MIRDPQGRPVRIIGSNCVMGDVLTVVEEGTYERWYFPSELSADNREEIREGIRHAKHISNW